MESKAISLLINLISLNKFIIFKYIFMTTWVTIIIIGLISIKYKCIFLIKAQSL